MQHVLIYTGPYAPPAMYNSWILSLIFYFGSLNM